MPKAPPIPIIHVASGLGQGGTARAIEVLALAPEGPTGQRAFALDGLGPISERMAARGIECRQFGGDCAAAAAAIRELAPAIVILHRAGRAERRWHRLLEALAGAALTIVEVNVFGWHDEGAIARGLRGTYCVSGGCTPSCPSPLTPCGRACVNRADDDSNCGSCGHVCTA